MTIVNKVENILKSLILKHDIRSLNSEIYSHKYINEYGVKTLVIDFEDEYMSPFLAGYVSEKIYDEWEEEISKLGFEIVDTDGSTVYLEKLETIAA